MIPAPKPADESARLRALRELEILDTGPEAAFDVIANSAAVLARAPIALVSLVDEDRQWFKARHGLAATQTPRDLAFCAHAILEGDALVVADAESDERFADNPLVVSDPNVKAYLGAPITGPGGHRLGTLCAIDHAARDWTAQEIEQITALARLVSELMRQRSASLRVTELAREVEIERMRLADIVESAGIGAWEIDLRDGTMTFDQAWAKCLGYAEGALKPHVSTWRSLQHPDDAAVFAAQIDAHLKGESSFFSRQCRLRRADGAWATVLARGRVVMRDAVGAPARMAGTLIDVTEQQRTLEELQLYKSRMQRDFRAAQVMQASLLEDSDIVEEIATASGCAISSLYLPADQVGGDLWGIKPVGAAGFRMYLADLSGHGFTAAINAFRFHQLAGAIQESSGRPERWLRRMNDELVELLPIEQFATCLCARFDPERSTFVVASAGGPPPILLDGATGAARCIESGGLPLGCTAFAEFKEIEIVVKPGDALLFYSDAILEDFTNPEQSLSAEDLARHAASVWSRRDGADFPRALLKALRGDEPLDDDLTMVFVEIREDLR